MCQCVLLWLAGLNNVWTWFILGCVEECKGRHCRVVVQCFPKIYCKIHLVCVRYRKRWCDGDAALPDPLSIISVVKASAIGRRSGRSQKSCGGHKDLRGGVEPPPRLRRQWFSIGLSLDSDPRCSSAWREDEAVQVQTARWRFHHWPPIWRLSSLTNGAPRIQSIHLCARPAAAAAAAE